MTQFVGSYVNDIRLAATASLVAQEHLAVLGVPGTGKTDILDKLAITAVGKDARSFTRYAPSTPPQRIEGVMDPNAALSNPPRFVLVRDGTPYDSRVRIAILDEWFRASDIVFDLGLDVCDRRDIHMDDVPVVWVTSNFSATSARTEALRDRFAEWVWLRPGHFDVSAIIHAHAASMHDTLDAGAMPDWKTVQDVRSATPGPKAIKVCTEILTLLAQEASKAGLIPNPRRIRQWFRLIYRTNVYLQGTADFTFSHEDASKVLSWAWACTDESKAAEWSRIAGCVVDIIGTAINELKTKTLEQVKNILAKTSGQAQSQVTIALGEIITEGKSEIEALGIPDPRVKQALDELEVVFVQIAQGKNPFEQN
jgi:MoxR-like ATPase